MEYSEFVSHKGSINFPANLAPLLKALLTEAAGNWDKAHSIAQDDPSNDGSWVHAYLHRREGDQWNASYWYNRAGKTMPSLSLEEEWEQISRELCDKSI